MRLTDLHIVLTYQCLFECGHCFIWGSPEQSAFFHLDRLDAVLDQAAALGTIDECCFEGGETFVYYPILIAAVRHATALQFRTAVVTNGYWANSIPQARIWLGRLVDAGLQRIVFIADGRGDAQEMSGHSGVVVAQELGLQTAIIEAGGQARGEVSGPRQAGWPQVGCSWVRPAPAEDAPYQPWQTYTSCPYGALDNPNHVHIDPFGDVHLCRGLIIGNLFERPLASLAAQPLADEHLLIGPLLAGGPAGLVARYGLQPDPAYASACQLCRHSRALLYRGYLTRLARQPLPQPSPPGDGPCADCAGAIQEPVAG